jgi:hypothetical protein
VGRAAVAAGQPAAADGGLGLPGPAGLDRLGRRTLSLTAFPQDLSLGLGAVGRLAFTAFWIYGAGFAPILALNLANPFGLLLILGLFLLGVGSSSPARRACTTSCWLPAASTCSGPASCTRAYEPVRSGSLAALGEQALQAAEVVHRRAEAIQQWPFQQRRLVQIAGIVGTVVTLVVTGIITRLILVRLGL